MILIILFASAMANTLKGRRAKSAISHRGAFSLRFTRGETGFAPQTSSKRSVGFAIRYAVEPFLAAARNGALTSVLAKRRSHGRI